jgi:hypothetical protein
VNTPITIISLGSSGAIGTAAATVDIYTYIPVSATAGSLSFTIPTPTANTTYGRMIYVTNVGTNTFSFSNTYLTATLKQGATASLIWSNVNGVGNWTYAGSDAGGIFNQTTQQTSANFNIDGSGTAASFKVTAGTGLFDVGTAGLLNIGTTTATSILIGSATSTSNTIQSADNSAGFSIQNGGGASVFTVDSTNTSTSLNLAATNGGAETSGTFTTQWPAAGLGTGVTVSRQTPAGTNVASGTASVKVITGANTNSGARYNLGAALTNGSKVYIVSFSARLDGASAAFTDLDVRYNRTGTTQDALCTTGSSTSTSTMSTRTLVSTGWTKVTCSFITSATAGDSTANLDIIQTAATAHTWYIDNLSVVAQGTTTQNTGNIKVGGATSQGLVLFQLDTYAGNPFTGAISSLAGAMYFDTTQGKMQCYDGSIWGACGAAPNTLVTITPEYAGAVLNGTGVGTLTSDFCGNGGGLSANVSFCAAGDARNYYRWTSPQATSQTYSIYVTYKLPSTFKAFVAGSTTLTGQVSSTSDADVQYTIVKKSGGSLTSCSTAKSVITGAAGSWWTTTPTTDPSSCSFSANDTIIFKIDVVAKSNASAYPENLNFQFSNQ